MPSLFFNYFWPGVAVWGLLYISDYALTLACACLYRMQQTIVFEGSYELTPFFQKDINSLRVISPRFVAILLLTVGMMGLLWILTEESSTPQLYQFALGCLIVVQLAIHVRHLRNFFLFRSLNHTNMVHGRIEYGRTLLLRLSSSECFAFSGLFLMLFVFTQSWFILGGAVGCLSLGAKHRKFASKHHANAGNPTPSGEQTRDSPNTA